MAQFSKLIITSSGRDLIAKILVDGGKLKFSRVCISESKIAAENLEHLTGLSEVKQESADLNITKSSDSAVVIEAEFDNRELTSGHFMRTLGLFAMDGETEVLYAAASEVSSQCYMPPYNGVTTSGVFLRLVTVVGNADKVSFEAESAGTATIAKLKDEIAKHNTDKNAHGDMLKSIGNINTRLYAIELACGIEAIANPFAVTFGDLSGLTVSDGVWNTSDNRIEF